MPSQPILFVLAAALAIVIPTGASAQTASTPEHLIALFAVSCFENFADSPLIQRWAKREGLDEIPDGQAEKVLDGTPGRAWNIQNKYGDFFILATADGKCTTKSATVAAQQMQIKYQEFVAALPQNFKVKQAVDTTQQTQGGTKRTLGHTLNHDQSPKLFVLQLTTQESQTGPTYSSVSLQLRPK